MTFVISLSKLMILLPTLSVIRCLTCGNKQLQLAAELESDLQDTEDWAGSGLLEKRNLFRLTGKITWMVLFLRKNHL